MGKFKLRQHIVDAAIFDGTRAMAEAIGAEISNCTEFDGTRLKFHTSTGVHAAEAGDWVVKGGDGRGHAMKPDTFTKLYEPA